MDVVFWKKAVYASYPQACDPVSRSTRDRDTALAMHGAPTGVPAFMRGRAAPAVGNARGFGRNFGVAELLGAAPVGAPIAMSTITGATAPAHGVGFGLTLNGRTDCDYQSRFTTVNVTATRATTCEDCTGDDCIHARGTLQSTFTAATTSDYSPNSDGNSVGKASACAFAADSPRTNSASV